MGDYFLAPSEHFTVISWREQKLSYILNDAMMMHDDDDDDRFGLDQHAKLDFYSASSLK